MKYWNTALDKKLKAEWGTKKVSQLAVELNTPETTLRDQATRLGLSKPRDPTKFRCGHPKTRGNSYVNVSRCRTCQIMAKRMKRAGLRKVDGGALSLLPQCNNDNGDNGDGREDAV